MSMKQPNMKNNTKKSTTMRKVLDDERTVSTYCFIELDEEETEVQVQGKTRLVDEENHISGTIKNEVEMYEVEVFKSGIEVTEIVCSYWMEHIIAQLFEAYAIGFEEEDDEF